MHQERFNFAAPGTTAAELSPRDPNVDAEDRPRLSGQNAAILALLREGREVSNVEMAKIAMKHTSRISDLRASGYNVKLVRREGNGVCWYMLQEESR